MKKSIFIEGIVLICAAYYTFTNDYIYDSLIGASVNISYVKFPISIGLAMFGLVLVFISFRK